MDAFWTFRTDFRCNGRIQKGKRPLIIQISTTALNSKILVIIGKTIETESRFVVTNSLGRGERSAITNQ